MGAKIYVGDLPSTATELQLNELFAPYGSVESVSIVLDRYTRQSRGFAFVEMSVSEQGKAAIAALNGTRFGGHVLTVGEARRPTRRRGGWPLRTRRDDELRGRS